MLTAKHSIQDILDAVAIQAGSRIDNPDIKEYDGDNLSWRLQAKSAQDQGDIVVLKYPVVDLYTEQRDVIPIRSTDGEYHKKTEYMHFQGEVEAGYQGWILHSDKLDYYKLKSEIQVVEDFIMFQEGMVITGKDMRIFQDTGRAQVLQGVKMKIEENK